MYGRRSKFDPLMNTFVVAGWQPTPGALLTPPGQEGLSVPFALFLLLLLTLYATYSLFSVEGTPFLGYVDKLGVAYTTDVVASGVGLYMALVCGDL